MFIRMANGLRKIKGVAFSILRYYGVIICTFAISVPLAIVGIAVSLSLEDIVTSPDVYDILLYPFIVGICLLAMLPFIVLGLLGNYLLLFFKWKRNTRSKPQPLGYPTYEHYPDRVGGAFEFDTVAGADKQNVEFTFTFHDYMRYCKARLNYRTTLCFTMEKLLEKHILVCSQPLGQNSRNLSEDFFGFFFPLNIQDFTSSDKLIEPVFDYIIPFE